MQAAERELRALRRELLLARAAAERAQLAHQLDQLQGRTRGVRRVAALLGPARSPGAALLGAAANALRMARRQPWVIPAIASGVARISRTRVLRWAVLAGAVAAAVWWIRQGQADGAAARPEAADAADPSGAIDDPVT